eukprot:592426-Amphidinium_carterae.1
MAVWIEALRRCVAHRSSPASQEHARAPSRQNMLSLVLRRFLGLLHTCDSGSILLCGGQHLVRNRKRKRWVKRLKTTFGSGKLLTACFLEYARYGSCSQYVCLQTALEIIIN